MKNKIVLLLLVLLFINCSSKKPDINDEYRSYQIAKGLDPSVKRPFQHFKDFLAYQDSIKKQNLIKSPFLRVNKVYTYSSGAFFTFSVFCDEGELYTANIDTDSEYLTTPENGIIKLKRPIRLSSFADFELTNDILKVSINYKTPFKRWDENKTGYIKNDTLHFTASYISKKYEYKKKWWAKTHKTDFINIYQPNLRANKIKDSQSGFDAFIITGEFNEVVD
ncbi:MAG TPA: hypothetical protein VF677_12430 [Flavobacterium sp.]|jgi:hypothetical protein